MRPSGSPFEALERQLLRQALDDIISDAQAVVSATRRGDRIVHERGIDIIERCIALRRGLDVPTLNNLALYRRRPQGGAVAHVVVDGRVPVPDPELAPGVAP